MLRAQRPRRRPSGPAPPRRARRRPPARLRPRIALTGGRPCANERAGDRRALSKSSRKSRPPCPLPLFSLDSRAGHGTAAAAVPWGGGRCPAGSVGLGVVAGADRLFVGKLEALRRESLTRKLASEKVDAQTQSAERAREREWRVVAASLSERERQRDRGSEAECPTHAARSAFSGSQRVVGDSGVP